MSSKIINYGSKKDYDDYKLVDKNDNSYYYYNINYTNNSENFSVASFSEERTTNVLDNCENYQLFVIRASIPTNSVPIFDFSDNKYYVTLTKGNNNYTKPVIYVRSEFAYPDNTIQPIFSYQDFINMINTALSSAFTDLKTAYPAIVSNEAPYIIYNRDSSTFDIIVQKSFITDGIQLWYNYNLYGFFGNYLVNFYGSNNSNKKDVQIIISDLKNNSYDLTHYALKQEYDSTYLWKQFKRLLLISNIPIKKEGLASNLTFNNSGVNNNNASVNYNVITDIELDPESNLRSYLLYINSQDVRWTDLMSSQPLRKVDLNIYWQDNFNRIYPLYIPPSEQFTIKILFRKKK